MTPEIALEPCRHCGDAPIYVDVGFYTSVSCRHSKGECDDNTVVASDIAKAVRLWNEMQVRDHEH